MEPYAVYIAGRFERGPELDPCADDLDALGYTCTSTWLDRACGRKPWEADHDAATEDLRDIDRSGILILFTEPGVYSRGGRHFESGYAYARHKLLLIVGPGENVFHSAAGVVRFADWEDCCAWLGAYIALEEADGV